MHFDSIGRGYVHADFQRIIDPNLVLDNLRIESRVAKLLRHVFRGCFILGRPRHVRRLRQRAQMFFRQLGIGHREKTRFRSVFAGRIAKAEDGAGSCGRFWRVAADAAR